VSNRRDEMNFRIVSLLTGLGLTASEVAQSLHAKGIVGRPFNCDDCPIANFLMQEGRIKMALICPDSCDVFVDGGWIINACTVFPEAITQFIRQFDARRFPLLLDESL